MKKRMICFKTVAGILAAVMSCTTPGVVLADTGSGAESSVAPVSDWVSGDTIEYDQLLQWIREYNPVIKSANESYYMLAEEAMKVAERMRDEANELYDEAKDLDDIGTAEAKEASKALKKNVKELRKYAKKQQDSAENMDDSTDSGRRQLNHTENTMVYNAQLLVNTYWQLEAQRAAVAKHVEAAEAALTASQALASQGMAVESGLLASASGLGAAKSSLTAIESGLEKVRRNIYTLTGQGYASGTKIGEIPAVDIKRIAQIDVEKDCETAVGNNYNLITQRHTEVEVNTNKNVNVRLRGIEEAEDQMRITVRGLYQDVLSKKASYDAAAANYEGAKITWNGAQIQNSQGMVNRVEFLQMEAAFLESQSAYRTAELELHQAMETYDWAVKGLIVSDSGQ